MREPRRTYLPAAGRDWLLPFYDPFAKLLGADSARAELLAQASIQPNHRILDIGCGTGSLVILIKRLHPDVEVVGLDPDPKALERARRKIARAAVSVRLDQGFSDELPYPSASFDRVFSSLMFHHLRPDEKEGTLREVYRVLKPGGFLHLLDFAWSGPGGVHGVLARRFHGAERAGHAHDDKILSLMNKSGFADAKEVSRRSTLLGRVAYYQASVPAPKAR